MEKTNKMKSLTNDMKTFEKLMQEQRKEKQIPGIDLEIDTEEDSPADILLQAAGMLMDCSVMVAKAAFLVGLMEAETDEDDEDGEDEEAEPGEEEKSGDAPENAPAKADKADKPDEEKEALRRELARFKSQTKDTLKKLGVKESDDPLTDLARLAAEANNETLEEYQRKRAEQESADEAQRFMRAAKFEAKMAADLAEVHAAYPSTRGYTSVKQLPNFSEFARLRDLGVSPKQAYIAANPDAVTAAAAEAARQRSMNDGKWHLKPAVRKSSKDNSLVLSKKDMAMYRNTFPELSDKEILALYKQANK